MSSSAIMLQGTGSDVGKSLLVAGLARVLSKRGLTVRPFKPQNMSNNAAVTVDGGEIGRAQALQARACGVQPTVHMNPVLLKPQTDMGSQIVVQGKVFGNAKARDYYGLKPQLLPKVLESFAQLRADADIVIVEGAGSPAEVNLRGGDIANMGFAEAADVPVVLVADIDRGGVLASIYGTVELLEPNERERVKGYIVNKFRGDVSLFESAIEILHARTGLPSFGVLPWFRDARLLPAEDAVALDRPSDQGGRSNTRIKIAVPRFPRISNFDDLDPLKIEADVEVVIVPPGDPLPLDADLILLPGSKTTLGDLKAFRDEGWDIDLHAHIRRGGWVVGICAGFQMLGKLLNDPEGIEGPAESVEGLGWLDLETVMTPQKTLEYTAARECATGCSVRGYEMHIGVTSGSGLERPMLELNSRPDGAINDTGRVMGCQMHGLFASDAFRHAFLSRIRQDRVSGIDYETIVDRTLDRFADHLEENIDVEALLKHAY